ALPHVDQHIVDRRAPRGAAHHDLEIEWSAGLAFGDVAPEKAEVEIEWTLGFLRIECARTRIGTRADRASRGRRAAGTHAGFSARTDGAARLASERTARLVSERTARLASERTARLVSAAGSRVVLAAAHRRRRRAPASVDERHPGETAEGLENETSSRR